jgi:hypothetical protein
MYIMFNAHNEEKEKTSTQYLFICFQIDEEIINFWVCFYIGTSLEQGV